jgi:hypothetical protein
MVRALNKSYLLEHIERAALSASRESEEYRVRCFIASLCGSLENDHPDVAKALALGAG